MPPNCGARAGLEGGPGAGGVQSGAVKALYGETGKVSWQRDIEAGLLKNALEFIRQILHSLIQQTPSAKSSVPTSPQPGCKELGETEPDMDSPKSHGWAGRGRRG